MLEDLEGLQVGQQVEALQVFSGLETENRYRVMDPSGQPILFAYEDSGFFGRQFMGGHRPLTIHILDGNGDEVMIARRKFFWFFSHLEMLTPDGRFLGRMQRRWQLLGRGFDLSSAQGCVGKLTGKLLRPNTFNLYDQGIERARITKVWSGIAREVFTSADNFHVDFLDTTLTEDARWLVLGAAFAIDLDFFERRGRRRGFGLGTFGGHSVDTVGFTGRGF